MCTHIGEWVRVSMHKHRRACTRPPQVKLLVEPALPLEHNVAKTLGTVHLLAEHKAQQQLHRSKTMGSGQFPRSHSQEAAVPQEPQEAGIASAPVVSTTQRLSLDAKVRSGCCCCSARCARSAGEAAGRGWWRVWAVACQRSGCRAARTSRPPAGARPAGTLDAVRCPAPAAAAGACIMRDAARVCVLTPGAVPNCCCCCCCCCHSAGAAAAGGRAGAPATRLAHRPGLPGRRAGS